ncbi:unnamed protein product [Oreochromis niloticus]|nr:unnamed protein product [Mustela putorius furo]
MASEGTGSGSRAVPHEVVRNEVKEKNKAGVHGNQNRGQKSITAKSGQDVTLTCRAPNNNIRSAHWSRAGLGDEYVLLYRGGQFVPDHQHPSFKNRVDLQDRQMKDGDVSLILRNVSIADIGTYECRVYVTERHSWKIISNTALSVVVCQDRKIIPAESRQKSVTLICRAPNNNITSVHWSRADLTDKYVLLYQDGQFVPDNQHPSFKNRVDLQDRQMKDGDVSLILKNVTINDTGTYECRVLMEETDSWKSISITHLHVDTSCPSGGHPAWIVLQEGFYFDMCIDRKQEMQRTVGKAWHLCNHLCGIQNNPSKESFRKQWSFTPVQ